VPDYRKVADALFADRVGMPLDDWIADRREEGKSWRLIVRELYEVTDGIIDVVPQTLINWTEEREPAA